MSENTSFDSQTTKAAPRTNLLDRRRGSCTRQTPPTLSPALHIFQELNMYIPNSQTQEHKCPSQLVNVWTVARSRNGKLLSNKKELWTPETTDSSPLKPLMPSGKHPTPKASMLYDSISWHSKHKITDKTGERISRGLRLGEWMGHVGVMELFVFECGSDPLCAYQPTELTTKSGELYDM